MEKERNREAFSFLNKQVTSNSVSQILASCTKILRLEDLQNVFVLYYLIVQSPKANPTALAHICKLLLIHPVPPAPATASYSPPNLLASALVSPGVPLLQLSHTFSQHHGMLSLGCCREGRSLLMLTWEGCWRSKTPLEAALPAGSAGQRQSQS